MLNNIWEVNSKTRQSFQQKKNEQLSNTAYNIFLQAMIMRLSFYADLHKADKILYWKRKQNSMKTDLKAGEMQR